jgi:hypothetical protein
MFIGVAAAAGQISITFAGDDKKHMPPEGKPQPSATQIDSIRRWIVAGAPGLPGAAGLKTAAASLEPCNQMPAPGDWIRIMDLIRLQPGTNEN